MFAVTYEGAPAPMPAGQYRQISGNLALAYGLVTAARKAGLPLFLGAYPITPASDVLHELSKHKRFGVTTFQAEDEIAGIGAALGASFAGQLGVTTTSGPGISLKSETIALGVMTELPLIVCDIQRAGPSTGMPTKTEQADLLQVMFGRNGEAPVPVLAAQSPSDCFDTAIEAVTIAIKYRTPVVILSDGYIANGAEPWRVPDVAAIPPIDPESPAHRTRWTRTASRCSCPTCATRRPSPDPGRSRAPSVWSTGSVASRRPRTPATVSYDPANHEEMVRTRAAKIAGIVRDTRPGGRRPGRPRRRPCWSSAGVDLRADRRRGPSGPQDGPAGRHTHLRHLNPFPANLGASPALLRPGARAGDEPRPARPAAAGRISGRRCQVLPGQGTADLAQRGWPATCERPRGRQPREGEAAA